MSRLLVFLAMVAAIIVAVAPARAAEPVLRIGGAAEFTREALAALPQHSISQTTDYTDGIVTFTGPLARDVVTPPPGATVAVMTAINDYSVDVPLEDFQNFDVILALEMDGKALTRRDKGPLWVMYPLADVDAALRQHVDTRLIWQLREISFR